ncbi:MAG: tRNA-splicing endonuclease subunit [Sclerophora amabilis]|nr:MAG: tRNA-splicing endonuclease subunit [Sclerophora amabilis]
MDQVAPQVQEPFPISLISDRYLIFDINTITYIRREYHLCGVMIGSLPQIPQQNVFLGVPVELMPEEARLLVDRAAAYVVDEVPQHAPGMSGLSGEERLAFLKALEREGKEAAREAEKRAESKKEKALRKLQGNETGREASLHGKGGDGFFVEPADAVQENDEPRLFSAEPSQQSLSATSSQTLSAMESRSEIYSITPTTSYPPLKSRPTVPALLPPEIPRSYPLFTHLHAKGYFISPGLRFGCHYLVYPGDSLRFHSHFLAVGVGWDEEIDLLDLVGGGRLGTGVKKGFLLGGEDETNENNHLQHSASPGENVRAFCIEWSGM